MFKKLTYSEFVELVKKNKHVAVYQEVSTDMLSPFTVFQNVREHYPQSILLETSCKKSNERQRSTICFAPFVSIQYKNNKTEVNEREQQRCYTDNPFSILRSYQKKYKVDVAHDLCGYAGGMVGYIGYEAIRVIENIPSPKSDENEFPDMAMRCYQNHIVFDHQQKRLFITAVVKVRNDSQAQYQKAMAVIVQINNMIRAAAGNQMMPDVQDPGDGVDIKKITSDKNFKSMIGEVKKYIRSGDVFQVVLSRKYCVNVNSDPFKIYRMLSRINPSPYQFYLDESEYKIIGSSPEKLVSIRNNKVETIPLAGTRAKQGDIIALEKALLNDPKEVAEHMMLVDLARNDLGKIAKAGTVKVTKLKEIEHYPKVMHISSTVACELNSEHDVFDVIQSVFPAGTLSGAPKIRAMQIIDEFEQSSRGIYGGVICAIKSNQDLDSCIVIRTAVVKDGVAEVRAGAGITYNSNPENEAKETDSKASGVLEAIVCAERSGYDFNY